MIEEVEAERLSPAGNYILNQRSHNNFKCSYLRRLLIAMCLKTLLSVFSRRMGEQISTNNREENGNPLQYSCLENPVDRGAWWVMVHRVARVRHDSATKHHHQEVATLTTTYMQSGQDTGSAPTKKKNSFPVTLQPRNRKECQLRRFQSRK